MGLHRDKELVPNDMMEVPVKVGISRCLLGEEVRYDGTGAKSSLPHTKLEGLFEYVDVCPEMAIGMGVPRPPIRVVRDQDTIKVVDVVEPGEDFAPALRQEARTFADANVDVHGFIFMHNSPSCGSYRVKVYPPGAKAGPGTRDGQGVFAAALIDHRPGLPFEDAGRLYDDALRENFVTRVFAQARWSTVRADLSAKKLIEFHSAYKYLLMAHSPKVYKETGKLLSDLSGPDLAERADQYHRLLMEGLRSVATRGSHANVLSHIQGYLKKSLSGDARQELAQLIEGYRRGELPLLVPIALLKHHFREHPNEYIEMQTYLEPHPPAAGLRRPL